MSAYLSASSFEYGVWFIQGLKEKENRLVQIDALSAYDRGKNVASSSSG